MVEINDVPKWDIPGWDWEDGDYAWLSSHSGFSTGDGVHVYFVHGGHVKHEIHPGERSWTPEEFMAYIAEKTEGLEGVHINYMSGGGDEQASLWITGFRPPNETDLARLFAAREREAHSDKVNYMMIRKRHPEWFTEDVQLDQYGRPV